MDNLALCDAALQYAKNGFRIFPLHWPVGDGCSCNDPKCIEREKQGKHTWLKDWPSEASADLNKVAGWWKASPHANIALLLDGLVCLDVDPRHQGIESLKKLEEKHAKLAEIAVARSGSGGLHYLFCPGDQQVTRALGFKPGLDLLSGGGGYIIVEPSLHKSGDNYKWIHEPHPLSVTRDRAEFPPVPRWLLEEAGIEVQEKPKKGRPAKGKGFQLPTSKIVQGEREKILCQQAGKLRHAGASIEGIVADLRKINAEQCEPRLDDADLIRISKSIGTKEPGGSQGDGGGSQVDLLLSLTSDFQHYRTGPSSEGFVRFVVGDHREVAEAKSARVREVLVNRFLNSEGRAPSRDALTTVVDTVAARCSAGPKADVYVRFARSRDRIYLDLCNDQWQAIEIDRDGWRVIDAVPVLFKRPVGSRPLPLPVKGGTLESLRPLLNASDDSTWVLMVSWLVGCFLPEGAFCHLVLNGEQGCAKSTTSLLLLSMVDPNDAGLSGPPKDETDATISALNSGVLGYDNLSTCKADLSDVFCRFSTGQAYRTRTLYETLGLTVASVKLPLILNGIDQTVMRGDLLERSIVLRLPLVTPQTRLTEQGIWSDFAILHPTCLGALLTAVSTGLRNLPNTELKDPPRMSDFCTWVAACEPGLPWEPGLFLKTYRAKLKDSCLELAEHDSVASAFIEWAETHVFMGSGIRITAKDLLIELNEFTRDWPKDLKFWPSSPEALSHRLVRLAPVVRAQGLELKRLGRTKKFRSLWEIWRTTDQGILIPRFIEDGQEAA